MSDEISPIGRILLPIRIELTKTLRTRSSVEDCNCDGAGVDFGTAEIAITDYSNTHLNRGMKEVRYWLGCPMGSARLGWGMGILIVVVNDQNPHAASAAAWLSGDWTVASAASPKASTRLQGRTRVGPRRSDVD
jgi:hypothetical protein